MKICVANFKAELTLFEILEWLSEFKSIFRNKEEVQLILCPPTIYLPIFKKELDNSMVSLGAQDISQYEVGKFTGEVTGKMVKDYAQYVLLGHSERRKYLKESKEIIQHKIIQANKNALKVILCLENPEDYQGQFYALAYEPTSAIGTGKPEDSVSSYAKMKNLRKGFLSTVNYSLYGGSVASDNVKEYTQSGFSGVLVGKASLTAQELVKIYWNL